VPMSLKVTASSLQQPDFPEFIGRALRTWNVPPSRLVLEVHESALAGDIDQVKAMLVRLKAHGLRVGVAGVGTGAASLGNVAQLPLDEIKLSAIYTANMKRVAPYSKVVRAVVGLAKDLGVRVTAEGVLDAETALALSTLGCERIQGDYVSEPLGAQEIITFASKLTGLSLNPQA